MDVGEIRARLTADTSNFLQSMTQGQAGLMALQASSVAVGTVAGQAFLALADKAYQAMTAVITWTGNAAKAAEATEMLSMRIGVSTQTIQEWGVGLARVGLSQDALAQGMRTLSREMVGLQNMNAKSIALFQDLGASMDQIEAVGGDTERTLRLIADRVAQMPDGAEKSRLAIELFGRAGLQLIPILNQGAAGLDEAAKRSREFGLVLTQTQQTALTAYDDALDDLGQALEGFKTQVGAAFAPSLTALVTGMTNAVVAMKNVFKLVADAAEKLYIRFGALVATIQLLASQLFSLSALSKDAWAQTLEQVKAIDQWAAAQLKAVDAGEKVADATKKAGTAAAQYKEHQEVLGAQIVATTQIMLKQEEALKRHQEVLGAGIVSTTQIETKQREDLSRQIFQNIFDREEEARRIEMLGGPGTGFLDAAARQEAMGRSINEQFAVRQRLAQQQVDLLLAEEQAVHDRFVAELVGQDRAQEALGRYVTSHLIAQQKLAFSWDKMTDMFQESATYAFGQIRHQFGNAITGMIQGTQSFTQFWQAATGLLLNTTVQFLLQMAVEWAKKNLFIVTGEAATAGFVTTLWATTSTAITGIFGTMTAAIQGFFVSTIIPMFTAIGTALMAFLTAIAEAAADTIFGIPYAALILAGVAVIAGAIGALAAFAFEEGGIVTKPTLGLIGEAGPEAVIPLDRLGRFGGATTIIVELDGAAILRHVANRLPQTLRLKGLPL